MGYIRHHAIIVTGSYGDAVEKAHQIATGTFPMVSAIVDSQANNTRSFFIPPDGSKEGWSESDLGDDRRAAFIKWLDAYRYEDGSEPLDWVEVQYGDDDGNTKIIQDSDQPFRSATP